MSAITGAIGAGLCLIALEAAVKGKGSEELTGGFKILDGAAKYLLDPTVPLIPDRRVKTTAALVSAVSSDNPVVAPKAKTTAAATAKTAKAAKTKTAKTAKKK
jgi:hypothetical protein